MDVKYLIFTGEQMFLHASAGVLGMSAAYNFSRGKMLIGGLEALAAVGVEIAAFYNGRTLNIYNPLSEINPPIRDSIDLTDSI